MIRFVNSISGIDCIIFLQWTTYASPAMVSSRASYLTDLESFLLSCRLLFRGMWLLPTYLGNDIVEIDLYGVQTGHCGCNWFYPQERNLASWVQVFCLVLWTGCRKSYDYIRHTESWCYELFWNF